MSIFGISGFFSHSGMPFLKPRGHKCLFVGRVAMFVLREGLHGLFCTGTLCKLHTTQVSLNKMFCSRSLISKESEWINIAAEGYISRRDHRLDPERVTLWAVCVGRFSTWLKKSCWDSLPCYFSFHFLEERPGVQPEREKSQSCSFGARKFWHEN